MSYDRPTSKDVTHIFSQYEELVKEYGLIRPGYNLTLDIGSKTYGRAYRVYEVADRSLWGKKGNASDWSGEYGSGLYEPTIGYNYLGMTAGEAHDAIADRKRMVYDIVRTLKLEKTNPILDCGHFPTPMAGGSGGTGKAYDRDDSSMCYACADDRTKQEIADPATDRVTLYVGSTPIYAHGPGCGLLDYPVTTWNGTKMGKVCELAPRRIQETPSGGVFEAYYVTVRMDDDGSKWYGRTSGPGMFVNLRRKKASK